MVRDAASGFESLLRERCSTTALPCGAPSLAKNVLVDAAFEGADAVEAVGVFGEAAAIDEFVPDFLWEFAWGDDGFDTGAAAGEGVAAEAGFVVQACELEAFFEGFEGTFEFFVGRHGEFPVSSFEFSSSAFLET